MTRYYVNATLNVAAWLEVEAETPEDAIETAELTDVSAFEYDTATAEVVFNVSPAVEVVESAS